MVCFACVCCFLLRVCFCFACLAFVVALCVSRACCFVCCFKGCAVLMLFNDFVLFCFVVCLLCVFDWCAFWGDFVCGFLIVCMRCS